MPAMAACATVPRYLVSQDYEGMLAHGRRSSTDDIDVEEGILARGFDKLPRLQLGLSHTNYKEPVPLLDLKSSCDNDSSARSDTCMLAAGLRFLH